ncbi:hypothetical protein [Streptomyces lydicamycinicus]|uniref:hypothetical protein n=1 Tax=Streptomyces lydicamycinicus TaxID=1546107 RepID=UPI003C2E9C2F
MTDSHTPGPRRVARHRPAIALVAMPLAAFGIVLSPSVAQASPTLEPGFNYITPRTGESSVITSSPLWDNNIDGNPQVGLAAKEDGDNTLSQGFKSLPQPDGSISFTRGKSGNCLTLPKFGQLTESKCDGGDAQRLPAAQHRVAALCIAFEKYPKLSMQCAKARRLIA